MYFGAPPQSTVISPASGQRKNREREFKFWRLHPLRGNHMSLARVNDRQNTLELARQHLRTDPVMAGLIKKYSDFDPRTWLCELPKMDAFGALIFQVIGRQLSMQATRAILERLQTLFRGKMPTPMEFLAIRPARLRDVGLSRRKVATLRTVAKQFVEERLSSCKLI